MDTILYYICVPLGYLMKGCWLLVKDYGAAILLFTLATKVILMPVSVWIQKNSIVMVRIQPEINFLKVRYYGDKDTIAEEQSKLFKREKYRPMLSLIPLVIQIVLLMAVIYIIYHPLSYLFGASDNVMEALAGYIGADSSESSFQLLLVDAIQKGRITADLSLEGVSPAELSSLVEGVSQFDLQFLGFNLSVIPSKAWGIYSLVPLFAALSSYVLSLTQNLSNVLQHEQSKLNQYGLMAISVGISLYLGFFVPAGTALYWIASNLLAIAVMYLLNFLINPKRYVDYAALEESRRQLAQLAALDGEKKRSKEEVARERADYRRFFRIVNKHVVIYSEKSGFYKYFEGLMEELLKRSNLVLHYVTNDPNDVIFTIAETNPRIKPYYIGLKKTIPLMLKLECDMMVMTTPDLDKFYLKRSLMQKDIEYVYLPHDPMSIHMSFREGALDAFDTIFCVGPHVAREVRATERVYGLPEKKLVEFGFPYVDRLIEAGEKENAARAALPPDPNRKKEILIAPSWSEDNLLDSCIDSLIESLYSDRYHLTIRPHPEYVKRYGPKMNAIVERYASLVGDKLSFELDFSGNRSIWASDLLITDWSGISYEFCIATKRPALFINTKLKCLNPNWQKIGCVPVEIALRDKMGIALDKEELDRVSETVERLFAEEEFYRRQITETMADFFYHPGTGAAIGAKYLLSSLAAKKKKT